MALVTFKGWEGKWWRNIKPGRAALDAALTVLPGSGAVATLGKRAVQGVGQRVGSKLIRKGAARIGRWFRGVKGKRVGVHPGVRAARGGSAITSGPLKLGGKQVFRAGAGAFNIGSAAKVAAVGAGGAGAIAFGKVVHPRASVTQAATGAAMPARLANPATRAASAPQPMGASAPGASSRPCKTCPPGSRMLCFKRKHNPEAEAKRRARRKAAREKAKAKTAKRTAKAKAASARRKSARAVRGVRRALRGKRAHRS